MARIVFLGSGSFLNYERARTSLALPLAGGATLLIETGDGAAVVGQLAAAGIPLTSVRHLVISHQHPDHAGGLPYLLVERRTVGVDQPLTISAGPTTLAALRATLDLTLPGWQDLCADVRWRELTHGTAVTAGDARVIPFPVEHAVPCTGVRLEQGGATAVFSADTRPCPAVVAYARGADLLIHEASGRDEGVHGPGHSTGADAGRAAREAGVKRLVLTHLPRASDVDLEALRAEAEAAFGGPVELAQDLAGVDF